MYVSLFEQYRRRCASEPLLYEFPGGMHPDGLSQRRFDFNQHGEWDGPKEIHDKVPCRCQLLFMNSERTPCFNLKGLCNERVVGAHRNSEVFSCWLGSHVVESSRQTATISHQSLVI